MSDNKKAGTFSGINLEDLKDSKDIVGDAVKAVSKQGGPLGSIMTHALGLTGSDGEMFSEAVKSYSNAYNPILDKMLEALRDDNIRKTVIEQMAQRHKVVKSVKKENE
jgi:hypothetical protein